MDLSYSPEDLAFREATRRWLETNVPRARAGDAWRSGGPGTAGSTTRGYVGMGWPVAYGGRGATPLQQAIVADEMARAGAPSPINPLGLAIVGPTIIVHGTEEQKRRYLRKILTAEELWCQLYSEPGAGSDLASLRAGAEDRGDHFVVNGQKIWTSGGLVADWGLLLARTDTGLPKHKGISCFLLAMRQPGVEVRPLRQITGSAHFSEVFMTDARVEKTDLVGRLGQGWEIAQTTLSYERGGSSLARVTRYAAAFRQLLRAVRRLQRAGRPLLEDPGGARQARPDLRGPRGPALRGPSYPLGAREGRGPGPGGVDHEALLQRVREALPRAGAGDPGTLGPGDERRGPTASRRSTRPRGSRAPGPRRSCGPGRGRSTRAPRRSRRTSSASGSSGCPRKPAPIGSRT